MEKLKKKIDIKTISQNNQYNHQNRERPSLIKINEKKKTYENFSKEIINPASSGDESDFDEKKENIPNIFFVAEKMTDPYTIMIVKDTKKFPKEAKPRILIIGIEDWVKNKHIIMFLEDIPIVKHLKINQYIKSINIFEWSKKKCAWIHIEKFSICESIANFFYNPIKKKYPSKNSKGEKIEIFLSYNLLEITKSNWYGVIIRNIPQNNTAETIKTYCENFVKDSVKYCIPPSLIKDCCIVVLNELENAEKLCLKLNNKEITKKRKLKVNFHPSICRIRNNCNNSIFNKMFNENGYKFSEEIEQSGNVVSLSTPLPLLYPKNEKNYENYKREEGEIKDDFNLKKK